jgi:hypothetical protein
MTLVEPKRISGFVELGDLQLNLDFKILEDSQIQLIYFKFSLEEMYVYGTYRDKMDSYSVINGIIAYELMTQIQDKVKEVKDEYTINAESTLLKTVE